VTSGARGPRAPEEPDVGLDLLRQLVERGGPHPGGGQLDPEGRAAHGAADADYARELRRTELEGGVGAPGDLAEEPHGVERGGAGGVGGFGDAQAGEGEGDLLADAQELAGEIGR